MPPNSGRPGMKSQSSSMNLMRADTIPRGEDIWIEDDELVWALATVLRQENTQLMVRRKRTGEEDEIDLGFAETYSKNPKVVSDMTALHHINEPAILYNLGERAKLKNQRPYTFMGTILIAVNPLRKVPNPEMNDYMDRSLNPEAPHPYAIAELAYHQMRLGAGRQAANQSIVVSGESGAGKTETSKIILSFLTHRSVGGVAELEQKVVDSSPILESFGNAKTLRNNNSSRFGKFLKLQFTREKYKLTGAFIETYLLEKSRVLSQGKGERNFHILYELVAGGAANGMADRLKLDSVDSYRILTSSGCTTLEGVDDAVQFLGVKDAFDTIGLDDATQMEVWEMLAAVLHLSNLEFDEKDDSQGKIAAIDDRKAIERLSIVLGVDETRLEAMLTVREVVTRGETFKIKLAVHEAELTRDAIVKSLYESLFLWIVEVINTSLGKGEDSLPFIGVLDIFGFENFDTKNEFEQLLINFTNESLQDTFNKQVFNNELKLYEEEGIEVTVSTCPDNAECLKMLTAKPHGIIPRLDNVCAEPNPTDSRYLDSLHKKYARHQDFPRIAPREMRECFNVKHYAGKVKYTVEGWVERNMDNIPQSFNDTLQSSSHKKVVKAATTKYGQAHPPRNSQGRGRPVKVSDMTLRRSTVAKAFLASMQDLNTTLLSTTCNFVRCIKPNAAMKCGDYNNRYVVDQLQCLGILQTCEVLKVGMPTRVTYTDLKEVLGDNAAEAEKLFAGEPETSLIAAILWAFEVPSEAFRLGRTRVFFRAGQISTLQKILNETSAERAPWIFKRLEEALANRQKAKAAAAEAQDAVASADVALLEAQEEATKALGVEEKDEDGTSTRPPPQSVVSSDEQYELESAAKKARIAGDLRVPCWSQVDDLIDAAKGEGIGTHVKGALDRVVKASEETLQALNAATSLANELDAATKTATGGDAAGEMQRLEDSLRRLRKAFLEAKGVSTQAEEAAAKCQARSVGNNARSIAKAAERQTEALEKAKKLMPTVEAATKRALESLSGFSVGCCRAKNQEWSGTIFDECLVRISGYNPKSSAAHLVFCFAFSAITGAEVCHVLVHKFQSCRRHIMSNEQSQGLRSATSLSINSNHAALFFVKLTPKNGYKSNFLARSLTQKRSECSFRILMSETSKAEETAKAKNDAAARVEAEVMKKKREEENMRNQLKRLSIDSQSYDDDEFTDLDSSAAPARGDRGKLMRSMTKQSVTDLLKNVKSPDITLPPKQSEGGAPDPTAVMVVSKGRPQPTFQELFDEAMSGGFLEGHLMKQSKYFSRWKPRYFRLEDGFLTYYDKKSLVGTHKNKNMELTAHSITSYTNTKNCFCVRTGDPPMGSSSRSIGGTPREEEVWFLLAKDEASMNKWMTAINAQIHRLFIKQYNVPADNYQSRGLKGRYFYRMIDDALPQWIRTYPEEAAPRTGDGLFPGEVIEVTQVLTNKDRVYLRIANDRGWTFAKNPSDNTVLFDEMKGDVDADTRNYGFPPTAKDPVPILFGPGLESQQTGEALIPGERAEATERFTPSDGSGVVFIKLADGRGWVPVRKRNGSFGVTPTN
ncbi:unnamed protein product [Ascophyllum nodosum]